MVQSMNENPDGYFSPPSRSVRELAQFPILSSTFAGARPYEAIKAHYKQARAICQAYGLRVEDVLNLSPKFWKLHADPANARMGAAATLIGSQYNLVVGTIAPYMKRQPDLAPLLQRLMDFDVSGIYMLTELGHGLDAKNLQTVATALPDGGFDLHTPTPDAAKCMPTATPLSGLEKIAIVFARLHIDGLDHGIRGFIVQLSDGRHMMPGITAKLLPKRAGANYLDHAITVFNHVHLPKDALLGEISIQSSTEKEHFSNLIWRVPIGTLSLSLTSIPAIRSSAWIAAQHAMKRTVGDSATDKGRPIIQFRTQQIPILHAIAQASVLAEYAAWSIKRFMDQQANNRLRHAHAMLFKTIAVTHTLNSTRTLSQEMGWRGLFEDNHVIRCELESRGTKIAEGDITVLCIRLASDILHGKVTLPSPIDSSALLSKHEAILLDEARALLDLSGGDFRSSAANRYILPRCQTLVEAIGHRMAYEAARAAGVDSVLLRMYEMGAVQCDLACYVEHGLVTRKQISEVVDECVSVLMVRFDELLDDMGVDAYCDAPILSDEKWEDFLGTLDTFEGDVLVVE
ncbi:hypothetical protein ZTR_04742 [Talaromyces verruculosus]|nr:hypothetical protein ZTR_04742 [Talaromyces verruculosus]